jgi:hypothetical protein
MGANDTSRIDHDLANLPNTFRSFVLEGILDDIDEESSGKGFTEITYVGSSPFVDKITTWNSPAKTLKRFEVTISYSPAPFVSQVQKKIYGDDGLLVATTTSNVTYNTNKSTKDITITNTRP